MKLGLDKLAQDVSETEVSPPEDTQSETTITCLGNCMYSQNPEKTCMLKQVTLSMKSAGVFECGQYTPQPEPVPQPTMGLAGAQPAAVTVASKKPTPGADKTKKPDTGLDKTKKEPVTKE